MKIRSGFVSNSSSSSFLIYGVCLDEDKIAKLLKITDEEIEECDGDVYEVLYNKIEKTKIELNSPSESGEYYIGMSWCKVKDDETGRQFKDRVEAEIEKFFGKKLKCSTYEEAWGAY